MKKESFYMISFLISILFFIIACYFTYRDGYARDAGIYVDSFFGMGLWFVLLGSLFLFAFTAFCYKKDKFFLGLVIISISFLIYGVVVSIGWNISYQEKEKSKAESVGEIIPISLKQLSEKINSSQDEDCIIYVGRNR